MVDQHGASFWIGSDGSNATMKQFVGPGRIGIPRFYLIDAKGVVVGSGVPSEAQVEKLLDQVYDRTLGRDLHGELALAQRAYEEGNYGGALAAASLRCDDDRAVVAADAALLRDKATGYAAHLQTYLPAEIDGLRADAAQARLLLLEHQFAGLELGTWAGERGKQLAGKHRDKRDKKALRALDAALDREMKARGRPYERKRARQLYLRGVEKHPRHPAAKIAAERAELLAPR